MVRSLGGSVEGKAGPNRYCSFLNEYDLVLNLWNVFICTCDIDPRSPWYMPVDHILLWDKLPICVESFDVEPTLHVIAVYIF